MHRRLFLALAAALPLTLAVAPAALAQTPSERDRADLTRVEAYLNGITTARARFVQTEQDGRAMEGMMYLQRPGKLRFEFVPPPGPYMIIADGDRLNYVGGGALTQLSLDSSPLSLLIAKEIRVEDKLLLTGVERQPGALTLNLVQRKNPQGERVSITFSDRPLQLRHWTITYKNGRAVTVALTDVETGVTLDPKLFVYKAPFSD